MLQSCYLVKVAGLFRNAGGLMSRKQKYDDYYTNGKIELARLGKLVAMKNHYTQKEIDQRNADIASHYDQVKKEIDELVDEIRKEISECDPLALLMAATDYSFCQFLQVTSEIQQDSEQIDITRITEYVQSIIISQKGNYIATSEEEDPSDRFFKIFDNIQMLYNKCRSYYFVWASKAQVEGTYSMEDIDYIMESQLLSAVRGNRYQFQQLKDLEVLISPHSSKLSEIYGISALELMDGLKKLEYSLSGAKLDSYKDIMNSHKEFCEMAENFPGMDLDSIMDAIRQKLDQGNVLEKCFGPALYDVKRVTGWPDTFVDKLSYGSGEASGFLDTEEFAGWPGQNLPVQKRPFVTINDTVYCFDYYNLFDNIYRILQKNIKEYDSSYANTWSKLQCAASEGLVAEKLKKILPNSKIYIGNYYPKSSSLKEMDENDVLAICDDVILIVEVKAGSFTYTPALTDLQAHYKSFSALIEKADAQCVRTLNYIKSTDTAVFYDKDKHQRFVINGTGKKFYTLCVTVDNFNVFEAKIEKTRFFNMNSGTIAISLDDFDIYEEYFDSELCFLHFLKQRDAATRVKNLMLNDELDHLGMYIENNTYAHWARQYGDCNYFSAVGFREDLDAYFAGLYNERLKCKKPEQSIPEYIRKILKYLEINTIEHRVRIAEFLLDFSPDTREQFNQQVERKRKVCKDFGSVNPFWCESDYFIYCCFVSIPGVKKDTLDHKKYLYANMMDRKRHIGWCMDVDLDERGEVKNFSYEYLTLEQYGDDGYTKKDIEQYIAFIKERRSAEGICVPRPKKVKIYPNEPCPCGSGKKYKKCCGKT